MNLIERQEAYGAVKERFGLRAKQRDALDADPQFLDVVLEWAHTGHWADVATLLVNAGIVTGPVVINIDGPNYGPIHM